MASWPSSLPTFETGLQIQPLSTVVRSNTSVGPAKVRRRYIADPSVAQARWVLRGRSQIVAFETFFETTTAGGSLRFQETDPISGNEKDWRFIPDTLTWRILDGRNGVATHAIVECAVERL